LAYDDVVIRRAISVVIVVVACGGSTTNNPDAGTGTCPATAPADSSPCTGEGLECEYKGAAAFCGDVLQCHSGAFMDSTSICSLAPNANCPATSAGIQIGQACTTKVTCDYPDARCGCVSPSGPPQVDGGGLTWQCTTAPGGCPAQHPALGTSCTTSGQLCDYGACIFGDNPYGSAIAEECKNGIWVRSSVPCPN
jgi:hypothetical protein